MATWRLPTALHTGGLGIYSVQEMVGNPCPVAGWDQHDWPMFEPELRLNWLCGGDDKDTD